MKDFKNKVVIVTGASSGIGEAMAREFAAQGARVVLGARSVQKLQLIAGDIRSRGGQAAYCGVDVTDVGECRRLIDTAVREFGGIDVLVCNAGLSMRAIFDDVDLEVLHRLMDVNFWGTVNCCKFALPYLQQSHGSIVGISSVAGLHGLPGRTGYSASKFAMTGFLETLRIENLRKGLHVMVQMPYVLFSMRTKAACNPWMNFNWRWARRVVSSLDKVLAPSSSTLYVGDVSSVSLPSAPVRLAFNSS